MPSIEEIEKVKPNWYNPDFDMSYEDQKSIWEEVPLTFGELSEMREEERFKRDTSESANVNGSVNGTQKLATNEGQNLSKKEAIFALKNSTYKTAPKEVAKYLSAIFKENESKDTHWLFVAQHWTPKTINSILNEMIKQHRRGEASILNPSAYFTHLIKFRKKRKKMRRQPKSSTNREEIEKGDLQ